MNISQENRGTLYAVASGLCYGFIGYFGINIMDAGLSVYNTMFWRFFGASLFMLIVLVQSGKPFSSKQEMLKLMVIGGMIYSLGSTAYFIAGRSIGTGLSMVIFFIYPAIVMFLNWVFFKTSISMTYYLAIILIVLGVVMLSDGNSFALDMAGIGFALLSAIFYAFYIIMGKRSSTPPILSTFVISVGCTITSFVCAQLDGSFFVPMDMSIWIDIVGLGIICTAVPILLLLESLNYISSEKASILSVLEPVFVTIFGVLLLDEIISTKQSIGIIVLLSGASVTLLKRKPVVV